MGFRAVKQKYERKRLLRRWIGILNQYFETPYNQKIFLPLVPHASRTTTICKLVLVDNNSRAACCSRPLNHLLQRPRSSGTVLYSILPGVLIERTKLVETVLDVDAPTKHVLRLPPQHLPCRVPTKIPDLYTIVESPIMQVFLLQYETIHDGRIRASLNLGWVPILELANQWLGLLLQGNVYNLSKEAWST